MRPKRGRLWRRGRHGGGSYYAGILDDGSRVVAWARTDRVKGDPHLDLELFPPLDAPRPQLEWEADAASAVTDCHGVERAEPK